MIFAAPAAAQTTRSALQVQQAIADLNSADWIIQYQALSVLSANACKEAVPALRNMVASAPSPYARGRALVALAEILKGEMANDALNQANATDPAVRAAAMEALGIIGDGRGESVTLGKIKDPAPLVQQQALIAYARLKKDAAYATVAAQLKSTDPATLRAAARAFVYVPTPDARKRLLELLEHASPLVRTEAAAALAAVQEPTAVHMILVHSATDGDPDVRTACELLLRNFPGPLLQGPAINVLKATAPALYAPAVNVLALNPTQAGCDELAKVLADANDTYELALPAALRCLYTLDAPRYLSTFSKYLAHKSADVRMQAVEGVLRCPKADHFEVLRGVVADANPYVANAAMNGLAKAATGSPRGGIVQYLAKDLPREEAYVGLTAVALMRDRLKTEDFNPALEAMAKLLMSTDENTRNTAAAALDRIAPDDEAKARVADAMGCLTHWMVIGTFPAEKLPFQTPFPPEVRVDYKKRYDVLQFAAACKEVDIGGRKILLHTPVQDECKGKLQATFPLDMPAGNPKFRAHVALRDNPGGEGAVLTVLLDGRSMLEKKIVKVEPEAIEVDLSSAAGKAANLEFVLACGKGSPYSPVLMSNAVVANDKTIHLLDLLPKATVRIIDAKNGGGDVGWTPYTVSNVAANLTLESVFPNAGVAYAAADINVPQDQKAMVAFRGGCPGWVFVNGKKVGEPPPWTDTKMEAQLAKGFNRILVKLADNYPNWTFYVRLTAPDGKKIPFTPVLPEKP